MRPALSRQEHPKPPRTASGLSPKEFSVCPPASCARRSPVFQGELVAPRAVVRLIAVPVELVVNGNLAPIARHRLRIVASIHVVLLAIHRNRSEEDLTVHSLVLERDMRPGIGRGSATRD